MEGRVGAGRGDEAGFTLVESLIAIVILAVGLVGVANLFLVGATSNSMANLGTASAAQAQEAMEKLKTVPFQDLVPGGSLDVDTVNYFQTKTIPGVGVIRTRWTIADLGVGGANTYYIVVLSEPLAGGLARPHTSVGVIPAVGPAGSLFSTFRACTTKGCPCCP